jgi:hypothetical protein
MKHEYKCEYDAYVSYDRDNTSDKDWIANTLVPSVEKAETNFGEVSNFQSLVFPERMTFSNKP